MYCIDLRPWLCNWYAMCLGAARKSATATAQATQCCQLTSAQGQPSASQPDIHTSDHSHKPKFEGLQSPKASCATEFQIACCLVFIKPSTHAHTRARTYARAHARARARAHAHVHACMHAHMHCMAVPSARSKGLHNQNQNHLMRHLHQAQYELPKIRSNRHRLLHVQNRNRLLPHLQEAQCGVKIRSNSHRLL